MPRRIVGNSLHLLIWTASDAQPRARSVLEECMDTFQEFEVEIRNQEDGITLHGTLALPDGSRDVPVVILVTGTGAHNRDEQIGNHRPFKVISDHLARHGFAVIRCDDRHLGMPARLGWGYTTTDFKKDALAVVDFAGKHERVDGGRIGIVGHSEGGLVAGMAASEDARIQAVIGLGAPAISMKEIAVRQIRDLWSKDERQARLGRDLHRIIESESVEALRRRQIWRKYFEIYGYFRIKSMIEQYQWMDITASEWNRHIMGIDPRDIYRNVRCPALMLYGEHDIQVHPGENMEAIAKINDAHGTKLEAVLVDGANHLFQRSEGATSKDYGEMVKQYIEAEGTIMTDVLQLMTDWFTRQLAPRG